ncbi:MAG TPA: preprotein translocase subunit SecE [bacterium]|nr:preprotein translocase subunit SecE [bacterium]
MADQNPVSKYLQETKSELKKVTWPTKKQTINDTLLVLAMSVAMAAFIAVLDYVFNFGLSQLISLK